MSSHEKPRTVRDAHDLLAGPLLRQAQTSSSVPEQLRSQTASKTRRCGFKRGIIFLLTASLIATLILTSYLSRQDVNPLLGPAADRRLSDEQPPPPHLRADHLLHLVTYADMVSPVPPLSAAAAAVTFDIASADVMVFLHIQKTGGTIFGKHLVRDLNLARRCECSRQGGKRRPGGRRKKMRCACLRPGPGEKNWLFSRYSTGWKCGLHPDWTELVGCVDAYLKGVEGDSGTARRYFYISFLRDPVARYLSEFRHVQRGATWKTASHMCGGRSWSDSIPKCYQDTSVDSDWSGVELEEFMQCEHNMAVNRQTRMLADLELVGCYNKSHLSPERRDQLLLTSAKANLERLAYFGLTEEQHLSQYLFQQTFNMEFRVAFEQYNTTHSSSTTQELDEEVLQRIREINSLDVELYRFALGLLHQRAHQWRSRDPNYQEHLNQLGRAGKKKSAAAVARADHQEAEEEVEEEEEEEETYDSH